MRNAISPRLAITIFSNMNSLLRELFNNEQRLPVFDRMPVFHQNLFDLAAFVRLDLIEDFHGLDYAKGLTDGDRFADFDERLRAGRSGTVESADHGRFNDMAADLFFRRSSAAAGAGAARWRGMGYWRGMLDRSGRRVSADTHGFFAFANFYLSNIGFCDKIDQFFYFSNIHCSEFSLLISDERLVKPVHNRLPPIRR